MSIDYDAKYGLGIWLDDIYDAAIEANIFDQDEFEDDGYSCVETLAEELDCVFETVGSYYTGETTYALFVNTDNYQQLVEGAVDKFIKNVKTKLGVELEYKDLNIIGDVLVS